MKRPSRAMIAAVLALTAALRQARADVVVIVSTECTMAAITSDQLARIYQGKSNTMTPVEIAEPSHTRREFYTKIVGKDEAQVKAEWSRLVFAGRGAAPKELPSGAEVVKAVAANPNVIGYVDRSFVNITVKIIYTVK